MPDKKLAPPLDKRMHEGTEKRHQCPYKVEINNDRRSQCHCCAECEQECRDDV